jgi:hypothetical protein
VTLFDEKSIAWRYQMVKSYFEFHFGPGSLREGLGRDALKRRPYIDFGPGMSPTWQLEELTSAAKAGFGRSYGTAEAVP